MKNAGCRGPHLYHLLSFVGFVLEMNQILVHCLHGVKRQNVGAVVHRHVDEEWAHFIGKVGVNAVVSDGRFGFRGKIVEIGLEGRRRDVEVRR